MKYLDALVLAGGRGERLRSVIGDMPKPLAPVRGRPFVTYLLDKLQACGISRVIISVGYGSEQIVSALGLKHDKTHLFYSYEETPLGTGGAIRKAVELMRYNQLLVMNGDSLCDADLCEFRNQTLRFGKKTSLVAVRCDDVSRYGALTLDDDRVSKLNEKGGSGPGWISAGVYLMSKETVLRHVEAERKVSVENDVLPALVSEGLYAWKCDGRFIDIGTPESYALAQDLLKD